MANYIWYAAYGSNMLEERFLCYIRGGTPIGSIKFYPGCTDQSLPIDNEEFYICSELYFARRSDSWNKGGVAFIKNDFSPAASTWARMYLITEEQFAEVVGQEINTPDISVDFAHAKKSGSSIIKEKSWYGQIIYLGEQRSHPIYAFTGETDRTDLNRPDDHYLQTIIKGIRESHNFDDKAIHDYLVTKAGIAGKMSPQELKDLIANT